MSSPLDLVNQAKAILNEVEADGRPITTTERDRVERLLSKARVDAMGQRLGGGMSSVRMGGGYREIASGGPGDVFVKSPEYMRTKNPDSRSQQWATGPVNVGLSAKGTLLEPGVGGPGGGLVPPMYQGGVVSKLFEPLGVADVFGSSQTVASQIRYVTEGTATSGAAGVAEGGTKPESSITMSEVVEPIRKVATVLPISSELYEDAASIGAYLNERLSLFVKIEEERQLLRGTGMNELVGLMHANRGINLYTKLAADDNATALARVLANTAGSSFGQPDCIVMHPSNWLSTRLLRDGAGGTTGQFFGGGPFSAAYGGGAADVGMFGQTLWNTRVVLSSIVGLGTALVGNFGQSAHIWRRGGVSVDASESHSDYYVRNLLMLRAEERLGLGVYRASAFTAVSGMA